MDDRTTLAAQLYAINYVKPCFKKDTAFYLTPKQAFRAADKFLAETKRQVEAPNVCQHSWGYKVVDDDIMPNVFTCTKCNATKPMDPNYTMSFVGGVTVGEAVTSGRAVISEPTKRVRFESPIAPTDKVSVEVSHDPPDTVEPKWEPAKPCAPHDWLSFNGDPVRCRICFAYQSDQQHIRKSEPAKAKREAREVWVCFNKEGLPMYSWTKQDKELTRFKFREILDTEEG